MFYGKTVIIVIKLPKVTVIFKTFIAQIPKILGEPLRTFRVNTTLRAIDRNESCFELYFCSRKTRNASSDNVGRVFSRNNKPLCGRHNRQVEEG